MSFRRFILYPSWEGKTTARISALRPDGIALLHRNGRTSVRAVVEAEARKVALEQPLHQSGWTVGRNLQIEYRLAGGTAEPLRRHAAELVALAPDVIVTIGST